MQRIQKNVVRGVAGHELVEQCRRNIGIQASHKAAARADEVGIDVFEAGAVAP